MERLSELEKKPVAASLELQLEELSKKRCGLDDRLIASSNRQVTLFSIMLVILDPAGTIVAASRYERIYSTAATC